MSLGTENKRPHTLKFQGAWRQRGCSAARALERRSNTILMRGDRFARESRYRSVCDFAVKSFRLCLGWCRDCAHFGSREMPRVLITFFFVTLAIGMMIEPREPASVWLLPNLPYLQDDLIGVVGFFECLPQTAGRARQ